MTTTNSRRLLTPAFVAATRYLGWGEPRQGVWFIGLEEADGWYDEPADSVVRKYEALGEVSTPTTQIDFAALGNSGREIRQRTARIMSTVSERARAIQPAEERGRWYHDNMLWRSGSKGFQANLYPLGKKSRGAWPVEFEELFGFGPGERDLYANAVRETRFPRLRARWLEDSPQATICFGAEGWDDFKAVFGLSAPARELANGKIQVFDPERVVLTYFFARNHVTEQDADLIGALLSEEWGVRVP